MTVRRACAVAACVPLLVLTACSGDDEGDAGDEPSSTTSSGTGLDQPSLPARAEQDSPAGAQAFVRHWVDALNHAGATGTTDYLRSLSADSCTTCDRLATGIEDLYGKGGRLQSDGWQVLGTRVVPGTPDDEAALRLRVRRPPEAVYASEGAQAEVFRGSTGRYGVRLAWDGGWQVVAMAPLTKPKAG